MSDNGQEKQVLFEIKQLCKSFGPTKVLDHIDAFLKPSGNADLGRDFI